MTARLGRMKTPGQKAAAYLFQDAGPITRDAALIAVTAAAVCYGDPPVNVLAAHKTRDDYLRRAYAPAAVALAEVFETSLAMACDALEINSGAAYNAKRAPRSHFTAAAHAAADALRWHIKAKAEAAARLAAGEGEKPGPEARPKPSAKDLERKTPRGVPGPRKGPPEPDFLPYEPKRVDVIRRGLVPGAGRNVRPKGKGPQARPPGRVPDVNDRIVAWVTPAARKGADIAELAGFFGVDPDALRLALSRAGVPVNDRRGRAA